jgi:hypothetical protein
MDSKVVAKEIKREIWPLLQGEGFTEFSAKTARRYTPDQIHVVNYQSFNSYLAEGVGCTTFSFALNLGIFFRAIPYESSLKKGPDPSVKPQVYHCHFRNRLLKNIEQPILPRRDTWYVQPDGSNLRECLDDSRKAIVLALLMEQEQLPEVYASRTSPARKRMIGYIARRIGRIDMAEPLIAEAESGMKAFRERVTSLGRRRNRKAETK